MKRRSRRRLGSPPPPHGARVCSGSGGAGLDRISSLSDDLLLQVLLLLDDGGLRAAARTTLLSRRWRDLWTSLPVAIFQDIPFHSLETALGRVSGSSAMSLLEIRVPGTSALNRPDAAGVNSLLRAASRLSPEQLIFDLPLGPSMWSQQIVLPSFQRATSIELDGIWASLRVPVRADFAALTTLSLSCCVVDLRRLLRRCPRLHVLRLIQHYDWTFGQEFAFSSASLKELVLHCNGAKTRRISIVAPVLERLTGSFQVPEKLSLSIMAPRLENVSWDCFYISLRRTIGFGVWALNRVAFRRSAPERSHGSLHVAASIDHSFADREKNFKQEIEKHLQIASSLCLLELHLTTWGHVYGELVLHLLGVQRIRTANLQRLKIVVKKVKEKNGWTCPCEPTNWTTQTISLSHLEQVEIDGFHGEDHEFDLLEVISSCAPMLTRMDVKMAPEPTPRNDEYTEMYNFFKAYPSIECNVYSTSGQLVDFTLDRN